MEDDGIKFTYYQYKLLLKKNNVRKILRQGNNAKCLCDQRSNLNIHLKDFNKTISWNVVRVKTKE